VTTGALLGGVYALRERVAEGGSGRLFRAEDRRTGQQVACKLSSEQGPAAQARFTREAALLSALDHPGIVRLLDHGDHQGSPYLILEWLDGSSLAAALEPGPFPPAEAIRVIQRAAEAAGEVHRKGFLHGDLSPANVMLVGPDRDRIVLIDFGVGLPGPSPEDRWGTPGYMAPEQAAGEGQVDARADVFALGCLLFRCLVGRGPFVGATLAAILAKVLIEPVAPVSSLVPGVDPALDAVLARLLAKDPAERPPDGAAVARELAALTAAPPGEPRRVSLTRRELRSRTLLLSGQDATLAAGANLGPPVRLADGKLLWLLDDWSTAAERAARVALELHGRGARGVVVATGRAVAGRQTPEGDAVDLAITLLQAAERAPGPGPLIDEATAGLLAGRFAVEEGPGGWWLLGESRGLSSLLGRPSPFVGRSDELRTIEDTFRQTLAGQGPRAVLVLGETGAGKTRLAREWLRQLNDRARCWIARGDPLSAGSPFGLLGQLLRSALGLREGDPLDAHRRALRDRTLALVGEAQADRVAEFLGALLGIPFPASVQLRAAREDAVLMGDQMLRAFLDWLRAEASLRPILLLLDDLQWGDLPSLRYLDAALRQEPGLRLMVLALADPEIDLIFPGLWGQTDPLRVELGPLSAEEGLEVARNVAGSREEQAREELRELVERSGGHPFFLEELLRARAKGGVGEDPASALAVLSGRLTGLSPEARRALRAASCFGRVFWAGGVGELMGLDPKQPLEELQEEELIARRPRSRFPGEEEYAFRQALVRSAAYATLTSDDLRLGHALAGRWLERQGERDPAVLAEHFARGGEARQAANFYRIAAAQALDGNDLVGVVAQAERGLRSGARGPLAGELRLLQAEALHWQGELESSERCAEEALERLSPGAPPWYLAAGLLASLSARLGRATRLQELGLLLHASPAAPPCDARQIALAQTAIHLIFAGQVRFARALLADLGEPPRSDEKPGVAAWIHRARAHLATADGDLPGGLLWTELAVGCYRLAGDLRNTCSQLANAGSARNEVGCYEEAEGMLREAEKLAERLGLRPGRAAARLNLGITLASLGRLEEAEATERQAIADFSEMGHHRLHLGARVYLARILLRAGRVGEAAGLAQHAVDRLDDAPSEQIVALTVLARCRLAQRDPQAAVAASREAWSLLQRVGHVDEGEVALHRVHGEALLALGLRDEAAVVLRAGVAWVERWAASLRDEATRRCFLERAEDTVALRDLAACCGLTEGNLQG
jgi:tetratricopeptide (TPR) repeat protein/predicted Ser/Thr protein kinase